MPYSARAFKASPTPLPACSPGNRQRVRIPLRLVTAPFSTDAALSAYVKVKALAQRPEGCTAGVAVLARYLNLGKSTVERALGELMRPAPDGVVELTSLRRSHPSGRGATAVRRVRQLEAGEAFLWLPVRAAEEMTSRQLRVYALLAHAQTRRMPVALAELAAGLRHHSGLRAGRALSAGAAARLVDEVESMGWIGLERRSGAYGRHSYSVYDVPAGAVLEEGSGPVVRDGSLASKEDHMTERYEYPAPPGVTAAGETTVVYAGPPLTFSHRLHQVLEPVRHLMAQVTSRYVLRGIGREVSAQLGLGMSMERLRGRVERRLARTMSDEILDPGRWLLGVALPQWGCGDWACEEGVQWTTGRPCGVCQVLRRPQTVSSGTSSGTSPRPSFRVGPPRDRKTTPASVSMRWTQPNDLPVCSARDRTEVPLR